MQNGQWYAIEAFNEQSDSGTAVVMSTGRSDLCSSSGSAADWLCDLIKLLNLSES